jgi:TRAP-type C4-dicarboxylate transport system permease small subunit
VFSDEKAESLERIIQFLLTKLVDYVSAFFISVISVLVISQVICRYVLNNPLSWSEELSRYLIIWLTFVGASLGVRRKGHIAIEVFIKLLPRTFQRVCHLMAEILVILFLAVLVWQGSKVVAVTMVFRSTALSIPQGYVFLAVPVGSAIMLYQKIIQVLRPDKGF